MVGIADFGAFVEIFPPTACCNSEIAENRIRNVRVMNEGDQVMVKVVGIEGTRSLSAG